MNNIGPQYDKDDKFKKIARKHQSRFLSHVLQARYKEYVVKGTVLFNFII